MEYAAFVFLEPTPLVLVKELVITVNRGTFVLKGSEVRAVWAPTLFLA
jgi:hypothetical protein